MRLFVAIEIADSVRSNIASLLRELRTISPQTKWTRPENLHLTLKFLGETDPAKLNGLKSALAAIRSPQEINFELKGVGFFPNVKRPRVFWAGIQGSINLSAIAREIDRATHLLGFPLEDRAFSPHLTLARLQESFPSTALQAAIAENASRGFGAFSTREFHLIESKLKSSGAEYTTLQSFRFVAEA